MMMIMMMMMIMIMKIIIIIIIIIIIVFIGKNILNNRRAQFTYNEIIYNKKAVYKKQN